MMTGKKYIDFFPLDAEREVELSAGKCPRCEQSTARPHCGVRPHGAVRGAVPRDPLGPRASPPRAPDGRHRDISSAARAAPPAPRPLPPALSAPRRPSPPPSRSPYAVPTHPRRSPSSAPSSSAPGGRAPIPERSRCRDTGGGHGARGGAELRWAPPRRWGRGLWGGASSPHLQTASPPIQSDLITDYLLVIKAINN